MGTAARAKRAKHAAKEEIGVEETPYHPQACAPQLIKKLEVACRLNGVRPAQVFPDWVDLCWALLRCQNAHLVALLKGEELPPDPPDVADLYTKLRARYRPEVFTAFYEAYLLYLDHAEHIWDDTLGTIYQTWSNASNARAGQYFTPWNVCYLMARMQRVPDLVMRNLKTAIDQSPIAQAGVLVVGLTGRAFEAHAPEEEQPDLLDAFLRFVVLPALDHYEPVRVCDPCIGSGALLLAVAAQLPGWMLHSCMVQFYGQDIDGFCVRMAQVQLRAHGIHTFHDEADRATYHAMLTLLAARRPDDLPAARPDVQVTPFTPNPSPPTPTPAAQAAQLALFDTPSGPTVTLPTGQRPEARRQRQARQPEGVGQPSLFGLTE